MNQSGPCTAPLCERPQATDCPGQGDCAEANTFAANQDDDQIDSPEVASWAKCTVATMRAEVKRRRQLGLRNWRYPELEHVFRRLSFVNRPGMVLWLTGFGPGEKLQRTWSSEELEGKSEDDLRLLILSRGEARATSPTATRSFPN